MSVWVSHVRIKPNFLHCQRCDDGNFLLMFRANVTRTCDGWNADTRQIGFVCTFFQKTTELYVSTMGLFNMPVGTGQQVHLTDEDDRALTIKELKRAAIKVIKRSKEPF